MCENLVPISQIESKTFDEVGKDDFWKIAMQEELNQLERDKGCSLVPKPKIYIYVYTLSLAQNGYLGKKWKD